MKPNKYFYYKAQGIGWTQVLTTMGRMLRNSTAAKKRCPVFENGGKGGYDLLGYKKSGDIAVTVVAVRQHNSNGRWKNADMMHWDPIKASENDRAKKEVLDQGR